MNRWRNMTGWEKQVVCTLIVVLITAGYIGFLHPAPLSPYGVTVLLLSGAFTLGWLGVLFFVQRRS